MLDIHVAEQRRQLAHGDAGGAAALDDEAEIAQFVAVRFGEIRLRGADVQRHGHQEALALHFAFEHLRLHAFVGDAFMGGMHIDDHQPFGVLRQHVDAVQLGDGETHRRRAGFVKCGVVGCVGRRLVAYLTRRHLLMEKLRQTGAVGGLAARRQVQRALAGRTRVGLFRRCGRRRRRPHIPQGLGQLAEDEIVNVSGTPKAHFVLGRMDVHIHQRGVEVEEQHEYRMATVEQHVSVRLTHGMNGQAVAHGASVDVEILAVGAGVRVRWQADPTPQAHAVAAFVNGHGRAHERLAEERLHARWQIAAGHGFHRA